MSLKRVAENTEVTGNCKKQWLDNNAMKEEEDEIAELATAVYYQVIVISSIKILCYTSILTGASYTYEILHQENLVVIYKALQMRLEVFYELYRQQKEK